MCIIISCLCCLLFGKRILQLLISLFCLGFLPVDHCTGHMVVCFVCLMWMQSAAAYRAGFSFDKLLCQFSCDTGQITFQALLMALI